VARVNLDDTDSPEEQDEPEATSAGRGGSAGKPPPPPADPTPPETPPPAQPPAAAVPRGQVAGKEKLQPYISIPVAEAARNAVVATTPFEGGYQSISDLIEDAIREKVQRLQRKFNNGDPFPERPRKRLKTGRPAR
jgi:hypothetical protein